MTDYEKKILNLLESNNNFVDKNLQIIACAGAGKTEFISIRIAFLIAKKITTPQNIVAFTFTERAAKELKFRIRNKIRKLIGHQTDIGDLYVGTIHSFANELLKEYTPEIRAFDVLDEGKRYAFISSIMKDLSYNQLREWFHENNKKKPFGMTEQSWVLNTFIRNVDIVREEMLTPEKVSSCEMFSEAFKEYEERLKENRFIDFSGMLSKCVGILELNPNTLKEVRNKYIYITVDEYQDINLIQERLINLLAGPKNNLCVVGDDDQSIYQWRGSTVDNIITFSERYGNVCKYDLPINYRSTKTIVELANNLIERNQIRLPKSMKDSGINTENGDIYKLKFKRQEDEIEFIINKIKHLIGVEWTEKDGRKRGLSYSDIAIFFRSVRYEADLYLESLRRENIPVAVSGIGGLFDSREVDGVFSVFSYLADFGKNYVDGKYIIPDEVQIYHQVKDLFRISDLDEFKNNLQELKQNIKSKPRISLQHIYSDVLILLGLDNEKYHDIQFEVMMYNLGRLSMAITDYEATRSYCTFNDINRFCWFIKHYAESSYDAGEGDDPTLILNAIQIMTLHGTKGLGFPVIFMPNCIERRPRKTDSGFLNHEKFDFRRYLGSEQDERRLFYVGITRSKKFLFVTTYEYPQNTIREKKTLKFFDELETKYCISEIRKDPTKRNKINPQPAIEDYLFPTSYSELGDYTRCEYDYKMRYIYGFNPIIVQALGYGKQVHNILNQLHKIAQITGEIPTLEKAVEILKEHFYLRYAAKEQQYKFMQGAFESLRKYLDLWVEDFSLSVKSERNFEMDIENALISGTIDLLKRKSIRDEILEIIDFKTGKRNRIDEDLSLQVQLYTIAAREALGLNIEKAYIHYLDDDKQQREEILITSKQLEYALDTIKDAVKGITTRRFRRNPRNIKVCNNCDWNKICPKKRN